MLLVALFLTVLVLFLCRGVVWLLFCCFELLCGYRVGFGVVFPVTLVWGLDLCGCLLFPVFEFGCFDVWVVVFVVYGRCVVVLFFDFFWLRVL